MLEPAEFVALLDPRKAGKVHRAPALRVERDIEEMQADAGDKNGGDRHQRQRLAGRKPRAQHRALVLAEQTLHPLQRDRIDVPDIAMDERHPFDRGVIGRVEAMIHARRQPQREEAAVAVLLDQRGIAEQIEQRVRRALDLEQFGIGDPAVRRRRCRRSGWSRRRDRDRPGAGRDGARA